MDPNEINPSPFESHDNFFSWDDEVVPRNYWPISWSDLMMTLFILFTALYIHKSQQLALEKGVGPINMSLKAASAFDEMGQLFMDEFIDSSVQVELLPDKALRIVVAGDLFFDTGEAQLTPRARERLTQISALLKENDYIINVSGHTDSRPNWSAKYPSNWELSAARAIETARFFIEETGIPESRFFISAHALHQPVAPNTSPGNMRLNRRVEIILMKERPHWGRPSELGGER